MTTSINTNNDIAYDTATEEGTVPALYRPTTDSLIATLTAQYNEKIQIRNSYDLGTPQRHAAEDSCLRTWNRLQLLRMGINS